MKKRIVAIIIMFALAFTVVPQLAGNADVYASGSKTKKMTVYYDLVKKGNTVCFSYDGIVLAAVNIKTNKVKIFYKAPQHEGDVEQEFFPTALKIKGKYFYYMDPTPERCALYRINVKTGKKKKLANMCMNSGYVISGNRIYYTRDKKWKDKKGRERFKCTNTSMKLNGKNKKNSSYYAVNKWKGSSTKKYKVIRKAKYKEKVWTVVDYDPIDEKETMGWAYRYDYELYLKKPNGKKIFICAYSDIDADY